MNQKLKNKRGITLIALVVTIVVLLILAGVSISLILDNNGIIQRSKDAKREYGQARANEQADLENISDFIDDAVGKINWDKILDEAQKNPNKYKHPDQSDTNGDIGIGTDGKPVNLDLWIYRSENNKEIILNSATGSGNTGGYQNSNIVDGRIVGTVPQYIKLAGETDFYTVTDMSNTFIFCNALTIAPEIPSTVTNLQWTFSNTGIKEAPIIPKSVTNMGCTFCYCTSLTTAPIIPEKVDIIVHAFMACPKLQGTIEINANPSSYESCFDGAATEGTGLVVTGKSTILDEIIATKGNDNTKITKGN